MEKQKIANCPCLIHTESRGYDWVVFRRQPDRTPTLYYDSEQTETEEEDEQDDDYFSVEPVDNDETQEEEDQNCEMDPDVTGAASSTNEDLPNGLNETPKEAGPGDTSSLHSRDQDHIYSQKQKTPDEEEVMESEDSDDNQSIMCAVMSKRSRADLSISEKTAQQKIYKIYMDTLNTLPDECGCGTPASISYMGHSTGCSEFQHIHERESHDVLLAILNKKKTLSFGDNTDIESKTAKFDVQADTYEDTADTTQVTTIPCAKETTSELKINSTHALSILADIATSNQIHQITSKSQFCYRHSFGKLSETW